MEILYTRKPQADKGGFYLKFVDLDNVQQKSHISLSLI